MNKWVILDREGVINDISSGFVDSLEKWRPLPGAIESIAKLSKAGFKVAVVTNQSGIGKGLVDKETTDTIHENLVHSVNLCGGELVGVFYCPHQATEDCDCRKPKTGLIEQIEQQTGEKISGGYCLGDSLTDLDFARAINCNPVLVRTGKGTQTEVTILFYPERAVNVKVYDDLVSFADELIVQQGAHA